MKKLFGIVAVFLATALVLGGCANETPTEEAVGNDETTDVVIVGAGLAGLSAAIELQEKYPEIKFILLEKRDTTGGAGNVSATNMMMTSKGTNEKLSFISVKLADLKAFYQKWFRGNFLESPDGVNEVLYEKLYGDISEDYITRLVDWGVTFNERDLGKDFTDNNPKIYSWEPVVDGVRGTRAMNTLLRNKLDEKNADLRLETTATDLITLGGTDGTNKNAEVIGVKVDDRGKSYNIYAKAVILATGGFGSNYTMMQEVAQNYYKYVPLITPLVDRTPYATGDAFTFTEKLSVPTIGEGVFASLTQWASPALPSKFIFDTNGNRFVNEDIRWGYIIIDEIVRHNVSPAYRIIDTTRLNEQSAETKTGIEARVTNNTAWKFNTIAEVEVYFGIQSGTLQNTIDAYNQAIDSDATDLGFGLPLNFTENDTTRKMPKIVTGPFYVDQCVGGNAGTMRSIKTDNFCRVVTGATTVDNIISGLYAIGECTMANAYPGVIYHGGFGTGLAAYTGILAVRTIADDITE